MFIEPSFVIDKYEYDETSERRVGFNRIYTPDGTYLDLTNDNVKQYLSYELMSSTHVLKVYREESIQEYNSTLKTTKLENCKEIWNRTEDLEN